MKTFSIKVSEYGIKKGKKVYPPHYTWDYCTQKKIPYIIIRSKIKYSNIDYDLLTADNGLAFKEGHDLNEHIWKLYEEYVDASSFPKERIPLRIIGSVFGNFTVFKKDQERMVNLLIKEIEGFVNKYGIIDNERKRHFNEIKKINEINVQREKYLEELMKENIKKKEKKDGG